MSERPKIPDNNECVYKAVKHCYYQDTSRQINQATCTNCLLSRTEKHLFSLVTQITKLVPTHETANYKKKVPEMSPIEAEQSL